MLPYGGSMMHDGAMNLIDALLGEHAVLYALFNELEQRIERAGSVAEVQAAVAPVAAALLSHAHLEEQLLFPALERGMGHEGPLTVMRGDHHDIDELLAQSAKATDQARAVGDVLAALELARDHFLKEERVLFHMARQSIDDVELHRLGGQWAEQRAVTL